MDRAKALLAHVRTIRFKIAAGATLIVALVLVAASAGLILFLREDLETRVDTGIRQRARDLASALEGQDPALFPPPIEGEEDGFVQVVDADGEVVLASTNVTGIPPLARVAPGQIVTLHDVEVQFDEAFRATAQAADTEVGRVTVMVGRTLESVDEATEAVTGTLFYGLPLLLLIVGTIAWFIVGRALTPVEHIRADVARISGAGLDRRVVVPEGGDEIARLAITMNGMLERLESGHRRQQRFVSDASHELRSPVATIRNLTETAIRHPGSTTMQKLAEGVLAENFRLQDLIDDLLLLARLDEHAPSARDEVDLDDLVLAEIRHRTGVEIDTSGVSAARTTGDARQLKRLIGNLIGNAIRHAEARVRVSLSSAGHVTFAVEDDGAGVPEADRERIFERFTRLDDARAREAGGAGLGLAIVDEVVRAHGGTVTVGDSPLGGALFEVTLPL